MKVLYALLFLGMVGLTQAETNQPPLKTDDPAAMENLTRRGLVVHLDLDFETIEQRVTDLYTRGVVMEAGETLAGLYEKRQPLYRKYAQVTIDCSGRSHEQIVEEIIASAADVL